MSTRRDPEHDLQDLLSADRGDLGHIYDKLARAEPPPRLDRIVLGEAARAIRSERQPRAQRWLVGFGSAAGIVLAAGIAWQVGQQMQRQDAADAPSGNPDAEYVELQNTGGTTISQGTLAAASAMSRTERYTIGFFMNPSRASAA